MRSRASLRIPLLLAAAGFGFALFATREGAGIGGDSCHYLSTAENVVAGRGLTTSLLPQGATGESARSGRWPPVFPLLLAAVRVFGASVDLAGRLVPAAAFAALILLVATASGRVREEISDAEPGTEASPLVPSLAAAVVLLWLPVSCLSCWAMAEMPFLALAMGASVLLLRAADPGTARPGRWAVGAAAVVAAAMITRKSGVALGVAFAGWGAWMSFGRGRLSRALGIGLPLAAFAPLAAWLAATAGDPGHLRFPPERFSPSGPLENLVAAARILASDLVPIGHLAPPELLPEATLAWIVGPAAALPLLVPGFRPADLAARFRRSPGACLLAGMGALHVAVVVANASIWLGAPVDHRYFAPAYPALAAAGVPLFVTGIREARRRAPRAAGVLRLLAAAWLAGLAALAVAFALRFPRNAGLSSPEFLDHPSSRFLRASRPAVVFSNNAAKVWFLLRRPVRPLPRAGDAVALRALVDAPAPALLVVYREGGRLAELEAGGLAQRWTRTARFVDCDVYARRE